MAKATFRAKDTAGYFGRYVPCSRNSQELSVNKKTVAVSIFHLTLRCSDQLMLGLTLRSTGGVIPTRYMMYRQHVPSCYITYQHHFLTSYIIHQHPVPTRSRLFLGWIGASLFTSNRFKQCQLVGAGPFRWSRKNGSSQDEQPQSAGNSASMWKCCAVKWYQQVSVELLQQYGRLSNKSRLSHVLRKIKFLTGKFKKSMQEIYGKFFG